MKFGIALPNFGKFANSENISEISYIAEQLGFDSLWVSDHVVLPTSHRGFGKIFYDPLITLSYISQKTQKISLGTSVIILPYRNPVVLAKMFSTLDNLSGGRVILGFGIGWLDKEFNALGTNFENRKEISEEYIDVLKLLYSDDNSYYDGKFISFSGIQFFPKTKQKPHPPIWIGGNSEAALKRAVEFGTGWHTVGLTPGRIRSRIEGLDVSEDFVISVRKNLQFTEDNIGDENEILRGNDEKIIEGIREYKEAGVSHLVFQILGNDFDNIIHSMEKMIGIKNA